jgi:hypothetical protein
MLTTPTYFVNGLPLALPGIAFFPAAKKESVHTFLLQSAIYHLDDTGL